MTHLEVLQLTQFFAFDAESYCEIWLPAHQFTIRHERRNLRERRYHILIHAADLD